MQDRHTENKTSKTCNYPKGRLMKIGMGMIKEVFVQPGDRLGCYSMVKNTSVTLEPRLSQKSIKIIGVLDNLKAQKYSVQGTAVVLIVHMRILLLL